MNVIEFIFWASLGLTAYAYLGYPLLAWTWAWISKDPRGRRTGVLEVRPPEEWPQVTLVIAAYKEESIILERLQNALMLDYPADRIEILVGVDGIEDLTADLVRSVDESRVRCLQYPVRRGKASVLNDSVPQARGDIVVFSDANTMMQPDAIKRLVRHFERKQVGGVCGKLVLVDPITGSNVDGMYWKFENFLKRCEGRMGALLGVNGAIYAIRKELYQPIPANTIIDDFLIGMRVHQQGMLLIYDPTAIAIEETPANINAEFHRRARIGAGAFQSLVWLRPLLNPLRGKVAFAFWSHKVCRWFCPAFLVTAMIANIILSSDPLYLRILLIHELFYVAAALGAYFLHGRKQLRLFRIPAMFVSMNAALAVGFWRWLSGIQGGTWKRTERTTETLPPSAEAGSGGGASGSLSNGSPGNGSIPAKAVSGGTME